jgi:hypothetical protein
MGSFYLVFVLGLLIITDLGHLCCMECSYDKLLIRQSFLEQHIYGIN